MIARAINSKLGETPGISYTEIASKALECGRTQLAIRVSTGVMEHCLVPVRTSFGLRGLGGKTYNVST